MRILIIGDAGVGKTTWLKRLTTGDFIKQYNHTQQSTYKTNIINNTEIECIELGGQYKLQHEKIPDIDGIVIMFDKGSKLSFLSVMNYYRYCQTHYPNKKIVLCGNKAELDSKVSYLNIQNTMELFNCSYYDISAKSCYNFDKPLLFFTQ